jgi:flagellar basal body-associated protein FliL
MLKRILFFYIDGFKNLSDLGRKLWVIIIIKLVVIFVVIKAFFFPTLSSKVQSKEAQKELYIKQLTKVTTTTKKEE